LSTTGFPWAELGGLYKAVLQTLSTIFTRKSTKQNKTKQKKNGIIHVSDSLLNKQQNIHMKHNWKERGEGREESTNTKINF